MAEAKYVERPVMSAGEVRTYGVKFFSSDSANSVTMAAPTGTDATITLPAATGTLATTADVDGAEAASVPLAGTTLYNMARTGAEAGWTVSTTDYVAASIGAPATAATCVYAISPLRVGASIVSFAVNGELIVTNGSDPFTLDAELFRMPSTGVPVSLGAITQVALTASAAFTPSKTLTAAHTVLANNSYYILVTSTVGTNEIVILSNVSVTTA